MGNMFSSGALFQTPPPLAHPEHARRGSGVESRQTTEPARRRESAFTQAQRAQGNLYSSAIDFRPGIDAPVDAPQVAAQRMRLFAGAEGKGR